MGDFKDEAAKAGVTLPAAMSATVTKLPTIAEKKAKKKSGLTDGEKAGIAIAVLVFVLGIAVGYYFSTYNAASLEDQIKKVHEKHAPNTADGVSMENSDKLSAGTYDL